MDKETLRGIIKRGLTDPSRCCVCGVRLVPPAEMICHRDECRTVTKDTPGWENFFDYVAGDIEIEIDHRKKSP